MTFEAASPAAAACIVFALCPRPQTLVSLGLGGVAQCALRFIDAGFGFFGYFACHRSGFFAGSHDVAELGTLGAFRIGIPAVNALFDRITDVFDGFLDFISHSKSDLPAVRAALTYAGLSRLTLRARGRFVCNEALSACTLLLRGSCWLMNSVDGVRYVSASAKAAISISALVALVSFALFFGSLSKLFPDATPISWDIWARGHGATQGAARADFKNSEIEAFAFLKRSGFHSTDIRRGAVGVDKDALNSDGWEASQQFTVEGDSYARFSTLANELSKIDPPGRRLSASFPPIPFERTLIWVLVFTLVFLCVSVTSVDFRAADVSAAPRGMHPVVIVSQTLLYATAIMSAIAYVHLNALVARAGFAILALCIVASIGVWLLRTRVYWRQAAFLSRAYAAYVAGGVALVAALITAIVKGPA